MGESFAKRLEQFGITGQIFKSARVGIQELEDSTNGFAPFPCFSTLAVLHLLCRWATCSAKHGGFRKADNRAAATTLLEALLKESLSGRLVELDVDCAHPDSQLSTWPLRPCKPSLILAVRHAMVDLSSWKACVEDPVHCPDPLLQWHKAAGLGDEGGELQLASLLKRTFADCTQLHCQLLTQVATKCEQGIYLSLCPSDKVAAPPIGCQFGTVLATMDSPNKLNHHLLRHVYAGVEASRQFLSIGLCNDKASVCGVTLDKGCFVLPNNKCSIAVLQALYL
jgi:hypothetical protein